MDAPAKRLSQSEREVVLSLYPGLALALDAAALLLKRRSARIRAERRHIEQGGPAAPCRRAEAQETEAADALGEAIRQWRTEL